MLSWVYIATNDAFDHLIKIGYTDRDPKVRMSELDGTGVPGEFKLAYAALVQDAYRLEQKVHHELREKRYRREREFFDIDVDSGIRTILYVAERLGTTIEVTQDPWGKARKAEEAVRQRQRLEAQQKENAQKAESLRVAIREAIAPNKSIVDKRIGMDRCHMTCTVLGTESANWPGSDSCWGWAR